MSSLASLPSLGPDESTASAMDPAVGRGRCQPDPLDPDSNICLANASSDERQCVSHFFGRNKKSTASIPADMFPVLCRVHYQEKQYRWRHDPSAFAAFQCDCILKTLEKMCKHTFVDTRGIAWPYWCGFELQDLRPRNSKSQKAGNSNESDIPAWLLALLCTHPSTGGNASANVGSALIGQRQPVRYSFSQIADIVKSIKTYVLAHGTKIPSVEALPITIGMAEEAILEEAKRQLNVVTRGHTIAHMELMRHTQLMKTGAQDSQDPAKGAQLRAQLEVKEQALQQAKMKVALAEEAAEETKETVPKKRQTRKRKPRAAKNANKETPSHADDQGEGDSTENPSAPGKRRLVVTLQYGKAAKRARH